MLTRLALQLAISGVPPAEPLAGRPLLLLSNVKRRIGALDFNNQTQPRRFRFSDEALLRRPQLPWLASRAFAS